jgi:hypothetical protein
MTQNDASNAGIVLRHLKETGALCDPLEHMDTLSIVAILATRRGTCYAQTHALISRRYAEV